MQVQSCTVFFEGIPIGLNVLQAEAYVKEKIPIEFLNRVENIRVFINYEGLYRLFHLRNQLFYQLEKADLDEKRRIFTCIDKKMHCIKKIHMVERQISNELETSHKENIGYGFIHCDSSESAQGLLKSPSILTLSASGSDKDLIWENLNQHIGLSICKKLFSNLTFILLFLVLFTPLALSSLISDILNDLSLDIPYVSQSLSSVVLSLFQYIIVPYIIRVLTQQELHKLRSEVNTSRIFKYLLYTIMNIIIFPLIGTVTLTVFVQKMIEVEILEWNVSFAKNFGRVGEFFVNFVISMGFVSNVLDLLALSSYFAGKVSEWQARTAHEENKAMGAPEFDFAHEYSKVLMVFAVTLVFSISTPIILPFGVLYMLGKYFVDKYNVLFAYKIVDTVGQTTQKSVMASLFLISSLFQSINSGLFIVSGHSVLIWIGGILSALSFLTFLLSIFVYKYWDFLKYLQATRPWPLKSDFSQEYRHPCEEILNDYQRTISLI